jgi:hypothetical protein
VTLIGDAGRVTFSKSKFGNWEIIMKMQKWRAFDAAVLMLFGVALMAGCGDGVESGIDGEKIAKAVNEKTDEAEAGDKNIAVENGRSDETRSVKRLVSRLPFGDVDPATAKTGIEPGKKVFAVKGVDANGKKFGLGDYAGKVILLDTWASW